MKSRGLKAFKYDLSISPTHASHFSHVPHVSCSFGVELTFYLINLPKLFEIKFQSQSRKFQWKRQGISRLFSRRTTFLQLKTVKVHLAGTSEKLPFSFQNFHCRLSWNILRLYLYLSIKKTLQVQFPWSHYTFRRHCSEIMWEIWKIIFEQFGFYGAIWIHCKRAKMPFWPQIQEIPFLNLQNTQISNIRVPHPIFSIEKNLAYKSNWAQFLCCSYFLDLETAYCQNYIYHTDNISLYHYITIYITQIIYLLDIIYSGKTMSQCPLIWFTRSCYGKVNSLECSFQSGKWNLFELGTWKLFRAWISLIIQPLFAFNLAAFPN